MKVRDAMSTEPRTIEATESALEAARRMRELDVGILPVVEDGRCIGVVTDRDLVVRAMAKEADARSTRVQSLMTPAPACCSLDEDVVQALGRMSSWRVRRLPVTDADDRVVGLLSLDDLARERVAHAEAVLARVSDRDRRRI